MLSVPNHSVGSEGLLLLVERRSHTLQALHASVGALPVCNRATVRDCRGGSEGVFAEDSED